MTANAAHEQLLPGVQSRLAEYRASSHAHRASCDLCDNVVGRGRGGLYADTPKSTTLLHDHCADFLGISENLTRMNF